ncbi:MAG TPA: cohesin domain-containing protein [Bacteroidales bacterium]|nr:cohesin domain-containing protein [Bacteroidales bacterium]
MKKIHILFLILLPMLLCSIQVRGGDVSIGLNMPDTDMTVGEVAEIPIYLTNSFTEADVLSYTLQFSYNTWYLKVESVEVAGTLAAAFGEPAIRQDEGLITISGAGSQPLSGTGVFLKLRIKALNTGWHKLEIANERMNLWNEGWPLMNINFGYIRINAPATFGVWSSTNLLAKGERLQYTAGTSATPVHWTVGDPSLASIDTLGWLTALAPGKTIVIATDTNAVRGVSQELEIRPARISVPNSMEQWPGDTINVPVLISDLNGLGVVSGQIRMGYNENVITPIGVIQAGTLLDGYLLEMDVSSNRLSLVFAGSLPIAGNDTLVMIRFKVKPNPTGYSQLEFLNVRLNESIQVANSNGSFNVRQPSWRYIFPSTAALIVGESAQFKVEGQGIPPYTWKSSDSNLATVSSEGMMKAIRSGSVVLTATDSAGITVSTEPVNIRDSRIWMMDTSVCNFSGMIRYTIRMDSLPRYEPVLSLQSNLKYDSLFVDLDRMELAGTMPTGWNLTTNETAEEISFAASGSTPLTHSGDLLYLWFRLKPSFYSGAWSNLKLGAWLFNEGLPTTFTDNNGTIQGKSKHTGNASIYCDNQYGAYLNDTIRFHSQIWDAAPVRYQWYKNGVILPGAKGPDLFISTLNNLDTISCKVTSLDPCIEDSILMTNAINVHLQSPPVNLNAVDRPISTVYPNPFQDKLQISFAKSDGKPLSMEVYDVTGRLLHLKSIENSAQRILDFTGRPSGIYLLKLTYSNGYTLHKVVKR